MGGCCLMDVISVNDYGWLLPHECDIYVVMCEYNQCNDPIDSICIKQCTVLTLQHNHVILCNVRVFHMDLRCYIY